MTDDERELLLALAFAAIKASSHFGALPLGDTRHIAALADKVHHGCSPLPDDPDSPIIPYRPK
jgi:hypothetical protein